MQRNLKNHEKSPRNRAFSLLEKGLRAVYGLGISDGLPAAQIVAAPDDGAKRSCI
jgi:hypothetical protein